MDATSAVVVLLFVVAIFGSFGNKGFTPPAASPGTIYSTVKVTEPATSFVSAGDNVSQRINRFIIQYRPSDEADQITASIMKYSQTYDINPCLVAALMSRESRFNPRAVSSSGAIGLGQLLPSTAKNLDVSEPYDIDQNTRGTTRYIKGLVDRFNGQLSFAIASYLEGGGAVERQGGYSEHTKEYVEAVLATYQKI